VCKQRFVTSGRTENYSSNSAIEQMACAGVIYWSSEGTDASAFSIIDPSNAEHFVAKVTADDGAARPYSCNLLGGVVAGEDKNSLVSSDSVFGRLHRPLLIPEKKGPFQQPPLMGPVDAQLMCSLLWSGEVDFVVTTDGKEAVVRTKILSEDFQDATFQQTWLTFLFRSNSKGAASSPRDHPLGRYLHDEQRSELMHRVVHRFLREYGIRIPLLCNNATRWLNDLYVSRKMYEEALDVSIIAADVSICSPECSAEGIFCALTTVGEVLEATGQFETAGALYMETATRWAASDPAHVSTSYLNAGLAYKRCKDYQQAEECYIKALFYSHQIPSKKWGVNDDHVAIIFRNILILYNAINLSSFHSSGTFDVGNIEPNLMGLLFSAGFDFQHEIFPNVLSETARMNFASLKKEYKRAKVAMNALVEATKSSFDVQAFRSRLASCWNQDKPRSILSPYDVGPMSQKDEKKNAKSHFKKTVAGSAFCCANCSNVESKPGEFLGCPCKVRTSHVSECPQEAECYFHFDRSPSKYACASLSLPLLNKSEPSHLYPPSDRALLRKGMPGDTLEARGS